MQYTQDTLFPDSDIVGTGRPAPWPLAQAETLPFDEERAA